MARGSSLSTVTRAQCSRTANPRSGTVTGTRYHKLHLRPERFMFWTTTQVTQYAAQALVPPPGPNPSGSSPIKCVSTPHRLRARSRTQSRGGEAGAVAGRPVGDGPRLRGLHGNEVGGGYSFLPQQKFSFGACAVSPQYAGTRPIAWHQRCTPNRMFPSPSLRSVWARTDLKSPSLSPGTGQARAVCD